MSSTPEFHAWRQAKDRCCNPRCRTYPLYGGRGIVVCERWRENFSAFYADMGPRPSAQHSLDRINNDGPYSPENCRWADRRQQSLNRRTVRQLTYRGETRPMSVWAELMGIGYKLVSQRLGNGWTVERALETPTVRRRETCWCGEKHEALGLCKRHYGDFCRRKRGILPRARLTPDLVRQLRREFDAGANYHAIARQFSVSLGTVYDVGRRRSWQHVT